MMKMTILENPEVLYFCCNVEISENTRLKAKTLHFQSELWVVMP